MSSLNYRILFGVTDTQTGETIAEKVTMQEAYSLAQDLELLTCEPNRFIVESVKSIELFDEVY